MDNSTEILKRVKLLMEYDMSKTYSENILSIDEQDQKSGSYLDKITKNAESKLTPQDKKTVSYFTDMAKNAESQKNETNIANKIIDATLGTSGTEEEDLVNAIKLIKTVNQYIKVDNILKNLKSKNLQGILNSELEVNDLPFVKQIMTHLESLKSESGFTGGYITFKYQASSSKNSIAPNSIQIYVGTPTKSNSDQTKQQPVVNPNPNQTKQQPVVSPNPNQTKQQPSKPPYVWKDTPFRGKEDGDLFRNWVNINYPDFAKQIKLDPKGKHNNWYIEKAWKSKNQESGQTYGQLYQSEIETKPMSPISATNQLRANTEPLDMDIQVPQNTTPSVPQVNNRRSRRGRRNA